MIFFAKITRVVLYLGILRICPCRQSNIGCEVIYVYVPKIPGEVPVKFIEFFLLADGIFYAIGNLVIILAPHRDIGVPYLPRDRPLGMVVYRLIFVGLPGKIRDAQKLDGGFYFSLGGIQNRGENSEDPMLPHTRSAVGSNALNDSK